MKTATRSKLTKKERQKATAKQKKLLNVRESEPESAHLIGAIAGGAKGAAIGAVIGGGAGAGSVVLQGKDDLRIKAGSQITVQSSSPLR